MKSDYDDGEREPKVVGLGEKGGKKKRKDREGGMKDDRDRKSVV